MEGAPSLELKVPLGGYGVHNHDIVRVNVINHYGTEQPLSYEVTWKEISDIIRSKEVREKIIETSRFRYENMSLFDPEYELLVEEYLEGLDEQRI